MEKMRIRFVDDCVIINGVTYNKRETFEFFNFERANEKRFSVSKKIDEKLYTTYVIKDGCDTCKIVFPKRCIEKNEEYMDIFESWYQEDRTKLKRNLKRAALVLGGCAIIGTAATHHKDEIVDYVENICTDVSFHFENAKEIYALNILSDEIRSHTGHGDVDGYKQSIEDHMNSYCYLSFECGGDIEVYIRRYCESFGLGEEVALKAIEKYKYYLKDDYENATTINLKNVYRENVKTKKIN